MAAAHLLLPLFLFAAPALADQTGSPPMGASIAYPETQRGDVVEEQFGIAVADPYCWLEMMCGRTKMCAIGRTTWRVERVWPIPLNG